MTPRKRPAICCLAPLLLALCLAVCGCGKSTQVGDASARDRQKRFPLTGEVLDVDSKEGTLRVRHEAIKGLMPAMAMDFPVSPGDLAVARTGLRIRAELVEDSEGEFHLENLWPADAADTAKIEEAALKLSQETVIRGNAAFREVGETTPEFALYDQDGRVVSSQRYKGRMTLLNFIFTRCQVTKMCPAAVARFQQLQREAREEGIANLELVSISLDPTYDTPGVLKQYANLRRIDTSNYTFLTGPEVAIKSLLAQFGVLTEFRGNILNHTATTVLIGPDGKILHRADGSAWDVQEFLQKIKAAP